MGRRVWQNVNSPCSVIAVVGAGRGPLVSRSLAALEKSGRKAKVYALDKNVSAFTTYVSLACNRVELIFSLQERKATEWHDRVEIIFGDMRNITVPALADIMVSELLGSFGDNELSPECLDGAMRFLKRELACAHDEPQADTQRRVYQYQFRIPRI